MSRKKKKALKAWGEVRFSVIGRLLASPPESGKLQEEIEKLAHQSWLHPVSQKHVHFGASTIERWYYRALNSDNPIDALERKRRSDAGRTKAMSEALLAELEKQYRRYPCWSYQLHCDNLRALTEKRPELGKSPSYSTVRRRMIGKGWRRKKATRRKLTHGQNKAIKRLEQREVRSYDSSHVHALWHLDFHHGRLRVADSQGRCHTPIALCVLDDRSRLCCHIQWYLNETAEVLQHGLTQAFQKRGLPRSLMTDNGAAMVAQETVNGLLALSVIHEKTLPYSPYQNGKQEAFWGRLEGRLIAMLPRKEITLDYLNYATQAWIEVEYNRTVHKDTGISPLDRLLAGPDASRPCPDTAALRLAFTVRERRTQRRSDGTVSIRGVRFEIPSRYRHIDHIYVRYRSWDLSRAWMVDPHDDTLVTALYPQDKIKNAQSRRRILMPEAPEDISHKDSDTEPPLLQKLLSEYASSGLPPAYLPYHGGKG